VPHGATFEDGYRAAEVCDAIARSAANGEPQAVGYRTLPKKVVPPAAA
jgi:predicted dehydrogenase